MRYYNLVGIWLGAFEQELGCCTLIINTCIDSYFEAFASVLGKSCKYWRAKI